MKKRIIIGCLALILMISTIFIVNQINNGNDYGLRTIKVAEVAHSIFYAPFYVAIENGFFEEEGLKIELVFTPGAHNVTAAVLSGDVEIGFCGPEASIYVYNENVKDYVQTFAGLTKRDGQFIVSRKKIDNFSMKDLEGKEVVAGRQGGMPILNFMTAVKNENLKNVKINDSIDFANLTSAFLSGTGDFVNLFEPNATKLEKEGFGYVVASVGKYSGEVPYTAFNAKRSFIISNPEVITGFRNAINKGIEFTINNDAETVSKAIINQFPDTSLNDLIIIVDRYKNADSWQDNVFISERLFNNLIEMMIDGGFIESTVPFKDLIINE